MYLVCSFRGAPRNPEQDDKDNRRQHVPGAQGIRYKADVVVASTHMWLLSQSILAEALLKFYATSQVRNDAAVIEHMALQQMLGVKRLAWASD